MSENELHIQSGAVSLCASLCLPDGVAHPAVVLMVHGSGPLDRNENAKGIRLEVFSQIAAYLSEQGIASLRYDKRGCGKSTGVYLEAGHHDLVSDANACIELLKQCGDVDHRRIYVLGHSEGSIIAPQLSALQPGLAGIILLTPFIQNLKDVLITQAHTVTQSIQELKGIKGIIARFLIRFTLFNPVKQQPILLERLQDNDEPVIRFMLNKVAARWLREMMQLDPPGIFRRVTCPVLIIAGEKDVQCDPNDVAEIKKVLTVPCESHVVENLTHILRYDDDRPSIFNYRKLSKRPVESEVLTTIGCWLLNQTRITTGSL